MPTRRSFFEGAGLAVVSAVIPAAVTKAQSKDATMPNSALDEMPRGLMLLAIKQSDGSETLGLKTAAGVIDVARH